MAGRKHKGIEPVIFSRFRRHVAEHDWFAVGVDFLVVVIGIFAAMQADNWNQERKDRTQAREYLQRLYEDADRSVHTNEYQRQYLLSHAELAGEVLEALDQCEVAPEGRDRFATGIYQLGKLFPPYMAAGTIEELRSTGKLGILDSHIRGELDRAIERYREFDRIWPQAAERVTPHVNYVDSRIAVHIDREMRGNNEITWKQLQIDLGAVCKDPLFYNAIAAVRNYTFDVAAWLKSTREGFEELRSVLKQKIEEKDLPVTG
jgi:hypothetical protein